jgi:GT2 family glycosyltransferase
MKNLSAPLFSVVILTYNRPLYIQKQLDNLTKIDGIEIIIVDNCSDTNYAHEISSCYDGIKVIRLDKNYGAVGRNYGIKEASADYIVTLDDDVWGIEENHLIKSKEIFDTNPQIDCICFHVLDEKNGLTTNWIHHCDKSKFENTSFETYEISEGAAIFRRTCFLNVGLYPEQFFISHEGPDLAFRIINSDKQIIYSPEIKVIHAHALEGRASWRRYYYDTRNLLWLAYRNYNLRLLITRLPLQLAAMLLYSIRDGHIKYYVKALYDALANIGELKGTRTPISKSAYIKIKAIDKNRPSLFFYIKERVFKREIKI